MLLLVYRQTATFSTGLRWYLPDGLWTALELCWEEKCHPSYDARQYALRASLLPLVGARRAKAGRDSGTDGKMIKDECWEGLGRAH